MKLLILGGTVFLGRHIVEAALARGHQITLFNRGRHNPDLFPNAEKLRGNREQDLSILQGKRWDAVIDTSGHLPRVVRASATQLAGAVDRYIFISTISVYRDFPNTPGINETFPLNMTKGTGNEQINMETIGPLKALCEEAIEEVMPGRMLAIRPGLIVGPHDPTGRFTYWPRRVAQGGEVLVPGKRGLEIQIIDARDLAGWIVKLAEADQTNAFNATGPDYPLTMQRLVEACRDESGSTAEFTHVDEDFLVAAGVTRLAPWIPRAPGAASVNCTKAHATGLRFRPISTTVGDILAWDKSQPPKAMPPVGLTREHETQLLHAWHSLSSAAVG